MKKMLFAVLLALLLAVPSSVFAGLGAKTLYSSYFNDSSGLTGTALRHLTWISVSSPDHKEATVEVTYYKLDGTKWSETAFEHVVTANSNCTWRPNGDLQLSASTVLEGSFVIEVTDGSIIGTSSINDKAGDSSPVSTDYNINDTVWGYIMPLEDTSSGLLMIEGFWMYDSDNAALTPGNYNTTIYINNPGDKSADIEINLYDINGDAFACNPITFSSDNDPANPIAAHETLVISPADYDIYGASNDISHGPIFIDVTGGGGQVIASCVRSRCVNTKDAIQYHSYGFPFHKLQGNRH